ncbi:hypothetical protein CO110_09425 [Candidatus Desantisbacteria bacterium CG_4_9_14_3_um_filter_40_11]|uniref:SWIM-type domain-containing protein n=2 Tax=unclassified Candidatus Desantisiibacteriota TaxID=3106372 RepID=A0A2M7P0W4_9BACT|nr:MAG: hypothetical protein COZ13_05995 [Candidatus Desantisbacteria bacterium CG_4_10_14_3_um_filter_40_18]PJB28493.1 MAG: hypothetical protein CO110_09425 [Candidatus Desantisbacteria bacterium CG_4_9_14_3_um_filter_40_11]
MSDDEFQKKWNKAKEYATQPERFELLEIKLRMKSTHDIRQVSYANGKWSCTCEFYEKRNTCSHIMAAQEILGALIQRKS